MAVKGQFDVRRGILTGADLSAHQYKAVLVSSGTINVPAAAAGDGAEMLGVLQDKPDASGKTGEVVVFGYSKVIAGEAISVGDYLIAQGSDTAADAGKVLVADVTGTTEADEIIIGRAMQAAAADGNIIEAFVFPILGWAANRTG